MGKFKEWMDKDRAKDIYGPMLADYDLKTTIELKKKVNRHINKVFVALMIPFLLFVIAGAVYMGLLPLFIDWGWMVEDGADQPGLILLMFGYMFVFMAFGYNLATSSIIGECNKRVDTIAGVSYGEETESNDKQ